MIIDNALLDKVTQMAEESPRLRMNYNLHDSLDAKSQRLLNSLLPGTNLPVHRHPHTAETYILLRGRMTVIFYNDSGQPVSRFILDPREGNFGVHIPKGQWHGLHPSRPPRHSEPPHLLRNASITHKHKPNTHKNTQ